MVRPVLAPLALALAAALAACAPPMAGGAATPAPAQRHWQISPAPIY